MGDALISRNELLDWLQAQMGACPGHTGTEHDVWDQAIDHVTHYVTHRPNPAVNGTIPGKAKTSQAAAHRAIPRSGTNRERVLQLLVRAFPNGMTDDEMQQATGMAHQSQTPRRNELVKQGWITDSGERRTTRRGDLATVWRFIPDAPKPRPYTQTEQQTII